MNEIDIIDDLAFWNAADEEKQAEAALRVQQSLGKEFKFAGLRTYANPQWRIATFDFDFPAIEFVLIPGGEFSAGLSAANHKAMAAIDSNLWLPDSVLPPEQKARVKPYLISRLPLSEKTAMDLMPYYAQRDFLKIRSNDRRNVHYDNPSRPVFLNQGEITNIIEPKKFDLPSEVQWEYAYRCGTNTLFPWGDSLPAGSAAWRRILLADFSDPELINEASNAFGLTAMQLGELSSDSFEPAYIEWNNDLVNPDEDAESIPGLRGGATRYEPWRDTSWILCISGSWWESQHNEFEGYALRIVKKLKRRSRK